MSKKPAPERKAFLYTEFRIDDRQHADVTIGYCEGDITIRQNSNTVNLHPSAVKAFIAGLSRIQREQL